MKTPPKSARAAAALAARIVEHAKEWPFGDGLGRSYDNCFEEGDGDEVYKHYMAILARRPDLVAKLKRMGHWCGDYERDILYRIERDAIANSAQGLLFA
jgi:hypothetical protein